MPGALLCIACCACFLQIHALCGNATRPASAHQQLQAHASQAPSCVHFLVCVCGEIFATFCPPPQALRRAYGGKVQQPVAAHTTRWASEEFTRGSYSFVAVGCSGDDYDALALPVARRLLFAGEHTCKEHPDTVGGDAAAAW
jgi:hypothetical protein